MNSSLKLKNSKSNNTLISWLFFLSGILILTIMFSLPFTNESQLIKNLYDLTNGSLEQGRNLTISIIALGSILVAAGFSRYVVRSRSYIFALSIIFMSLLLTVGFYGLLIIVNFALLK